MDAGGYQERLDKLLMVLAGDLTLIRMEIAELSREELDALLLGALLRVRSLECAIEFMAGSEEP